MEIELINSKLKTIIDDEDLNTIMEHTFKWYINIKDKIYKSDKTGEYELKKIVKCVTGKSRIYGHSISLATAILGKKLGLVIDHINRNPLDNRKCNLRFVTRAQNSHNSGAYCLRKTKGFSYRKASGTYVVEISYTEKGETKRYYKGKIKTAEEATLHANEMYRKLHGEFAYQNKI